MVAAHQQELQYAGLLERGIAWFIDGVILTVLAIAALLVFFVGSGASPEAAEGIGAIIGLFAAVLYYVGAEAKWAATPGKMALGLRVVYTDGRECTGGGAILRNITKILGGASLFPILVGVILILTNADNQRLGDMIGDTTVVTD